MLLLDSRISILKGGILAMLRSTFTALNQSSLKNNLWPLYKLLFSFFLLFTQLWLLIWTLCTKIFFWPFLVTQLLQNISPQMANGLLYLDNRIYIPSAGNLYIYVLQYNHNHILTEYFDQNKTLELVHYRYS